MATENLKDFSGNALFTCDNSLFLFEPGATRCSLPSETGQVTVAPWMLCRAVRMILGIFNNERILDMWVLAV